MSVIREFESRGETRGSRADDQSLTQALFLLLGNEVRRKRGPLAEEVLFHLLNDEFLRFLGAQIQPVLIHEHFHVLDPHLPRFFRNVVVDTLAQRMALKRDLVEAFHLLLKLDAEDFARSLGNRSDLIEIDAGTTAHAVRIAIPTRCYHEGSS